MTNVVVILQARMGSSRLPGKVLADVAGKPMLQRVIERARQIRGATEVLLATSVEPENEQLIQVANRLGITSFAGSESDVLDRYYQAARQVSASVVVRVTADCPLLDPKVSGQVLQRFLGDDLDYVSNTNPPTYPDGLDTEVFSFAALERAWRDASLPSEREHVTPYIWKSPSMFRVANVEGPVDLSDLRWTVDEPGDLPFVRSVYSAMLQRRLDDFGLDEIMALLDEAPELMPVNCDRRRNEGYAKSVVSERTTPKPSS